MNDQSKIFYHRRFLSSAIGGYTHTKPTYQVATANVKERQKTYERKPTFVCWLDSDWIVTPQEVPLIK